MAGMPPRNRRSRKPAAPPGYSAPALEKGVDILELLADAESGLTVSEISQRLGRRMSELFRIIVVLERRAWLQKDPETSRYSVTYHLLDMALRATPAQSLSAVAAPVMEKLSIDTNQSCHLVVRAGGRGLIIQRQENAGLQGDEVSLGTDRLAEECVASGNQCVLPVGERAFGWSEFGQLGWSRDLCG
jgi:DNA-binding IclR family transcriptional regulator